MAKGNQEDASAFSKIQMAMGNTTRPHWWQKGCDFRQGLLHGGMAPLARQRRRFFCSSPTVKAGVKKCCTLDSLKRTNNFVSTAYAGVWTTGFIAPTARTTGLMGKRPGSKQSSREIGLR